MTDHYACQLCDHDGYRNNGVCSHNPGQERTNVRGLELARAARRIARFKHP